MDSSTIELPGCVITTVEVLKDEVKIHFDPAYLVKSMTGSMERTRWYQKGILIFDRGSIDKVLPEFPCICTSGDIKVNVYTFRDMIPIPLNSTGNTQCIITLDKGNRDISVSAQGVRLEMIDTAKYIEHIR